MQDIATRILSWREAGIPALFARVLSLKGFSAWTGDELVALSGQGEQHGDVLGRYGAARLADAGTGLLATTPALARVVIDVHGSRVAEAGLSCGGQAELLLQPVDTVPAELWQAVARRSPVALITHIEGPAAGPLGAVVHPDGRCAGAVGTGAGTPPPGEALAAARTLLAAGHSGRHLLEGPSGTVLVEAWVPDPRLVVIGGGDLMAAIAAQARLLGWEARATESAAEVGGLLDWGGESSALVVLTHNGALDAPALADGLDRGIPYVGAMGSRRTQSNRAERLRARGVADTDIARIHRPIGLDLGGRQPAEVAIAICAQILAVHHGRDGRPLEQRDGPIHHRVAAAPAG